MKLETLFENNLVDKILDNVIMSESKMFCIKDCIESTSYGIYTIFPEIGFYISYTW